MYPSQAVDDLQVLTIELQTYTPAIAQLRIGYLLREILERCERKVMETLSPDRLAWIYCTHDTVIESFLNVLHVYEVRCCVKCVSMQHIQKTNVRL